MIEEKKSDTEWSKASENISKNSQSFLELSPVQKEVLLSRKLQDHAWVIEFFRIKWR